MTTVTYSVNVRIFPADLWQILIAFKRTLAAMLEASGLLYAAEADLVYWPSGRTYANWYIQEHMLTIVREYVVYVFFKIQKTRLLMFFEVPSKKM